MVLYVDYIFFINFLIHYIFISLIHYLFHDQVSKIRLFLSSVLSSLFLFAFLLDSFFFLLFKIFGGMILVFFSFRYEHPGKYIMQLSLYYLLEFSLIGIVQSFHLHGFLLLLAIVFLSLFFLIQNQRKVVINDDQQQYHVIIQCQHEKKELLGFLDTGNQSMSLGKPIVFLHQKYYSPHFKSIGKVHVQTIGGDVSIECFCPKDFILLVNHKKIHKNVLIAFADLSTDCLLNVHLFE